MKNGKGESITFPSGPQDPATMHYLSNYIVPIYLYVNVSSYFQGPS